jgi:ethanolamine ammonia-lyase large subunit
VRAGYKVGEQLFGGLSGPRTILHIIGERPGSGHHTMSVYITRADGQAWAKPGQVDHNITQVVSGIATTALTPQRAAPEVQRLLNVG